MQAQARYSLCRLRKLSQPGFAYHIEMWQDEKWIRLYNYKDSGRALSWMEGEESIETFQAITGADRATAEHVLEAHGWDLNRSVNFFMESAAMPTARSAEERAGEEPEGLLPARPSSGTVEVDSPEPSEVGEDPLPEAPQPPISNAHLHQASVADDEDLQAALAASLHTGDGSSQDAEVARAQRAARDAQPQASESDEELPQLPRVSTRASRSARAASLFGLPPEIADDSPRVRRNRPRRAAAADADMDHLAAMGFGPELPSAAISPALQAAFPGSLRHAALDGSDLPQAGVPLAANGNGHLEMPAGINVEEARMLEAAMLGIPYEGRIPAFGTQDAAEPVSPTVLRQRELREEQDQAYQESLLADKQKADAAEAARRTQEEQQLQRLQAEEDAAQQQRSYEREISDKLTGLPQEPSPDDNDAVSVMIRLPNGLRFSRRFSRSDHCQDLFDFVDVSAAPDIKPGTYKLVTQFPRRVFAADKHASLSDAGMVQKQEALFLEPH